MKHAAIIILGLMLGCTNNPNQQPEIKETSKPFSGEYTSPNKAKPISASVQLQLAANKPSLILFKHNNCKTTIAQHEKILHKALHADTLIIKLTSLQNCGTKYKGDFSLTDNHLNLLVKPLPLLVKHKNGITDTVYQHQECNCMYEFTYKINHIKSLPQAITINGNRIK
jgi:hypothetical protein